MTKLTSKGHLDLQFVNGRMGDPAVYGFFPRTGEALLFDCGLLDNLPNKDLLRVGLVLVSHTHIDHFIGFDRWLRVNIPHGRLLQICGPKGITENVVGKLQGYTWNLLEKDQLRFRVFEIDVSGTVQQSLLSSSQNFKPLREAALPFHPNHLEPPLPKPPVALATTFGHGYRIEAVTLDHGTPSVAYACQAPNRFSTDTQALDNIGLQPGPWLRDLQVSLGQDGEDGSIVVQGRTFEKRKLGQEIFTVSAPKVMAYATDLVFSESNLSRMTTLFDRSEHLVCESSFAAKDWARAKDRKHLTTRQAALIAAASRVRNLTTFHYSNIYSDDPDALDLEARKFFTELSTAGPAELKEALKKELCK